MNDPTEKLFAVIREARAPDDLWGRIQAKAQTQATADRRVAIWSRAAAVLLGVALLFGVQQGARLFRGAPTTNNVQLVLPALNATPVAANRLGLTRDPLLDAPEGQLLSAFVRRGNR